MFLEFHHSFSLEESFTKMTSKYNTPILFLIFNRPETTRVVWQAIKKQKPSKLFIAADGPRRDKSGEKERCRQTRKITEKIDWPCQVKRLYRSKNLGCKKAVSSGIDWFFGQVEEGIIIEDDCSPDQSFFKYCSTLLDRYRDNRNIMHIGGNNFQKDEKGTDSYYFSKYSHIWGWATWKRAWKTYSVNIDDWWRQRSKVFKNMGILEKIFWSINFQTVANGFIDTWDYQWQYAIWLNQGVCISPSKNLVINLGVGEDSTHTKTINQAIGSIKKESLKKIEHPKNISINKQADKYTLEEVYQVSFKKIFRISPTIIYNFIRNLWK